jgi:hypothetical protein
LKQDGPAEELDRASLLAALTRPVLERLVLLFRGAASEDEQIDAAAVLCCVSDTQSAHWVAEAGATNAAVCNLRSEDAGEAVRSWSIFLVCSICDTSRRCDNVADRIGG